MVRPSSSMTDKLLVLANINRDTAFQPLVAPSGNEFQSEHTINIVGRTFSVCIHTYTHFDYSKCISPCLLSSFKMVAEEGLEPSCPRERQILSLLCMPFHHSAIQMVPQEGLEPPSSNYALTG